MHNLFNATDVQSVMNRIDLFTPDAERQWGKMRVEQMLAHCNVSMETAMGKNVIKRVFIGRIIGTMMRTGVLSNKPFAKNSPTDSSYIFSDKKHIDFNAEKAKLRAQVLEFYSGGPDICTKHPHPFFGKFSPEQWAVFQWKHIDHHLRQFAA